MRVAFAHMGLIHIPLQALFKGLGFEVVLGPVSTRNTLQTGAKHSPEMVCLPFKVTLGNMIESLHKGADTLLFIGAGDWSCRFGYYGRLQCSILKELRYDFRAIFISKNDLRLILTEVLSANGGNPFRALKNSAKSLLTAWIKSKQIETIETLARKIRPVEKTDGQTDSVSRELINRVSKTSSVRNLLKLTRSINQTFKTIDYHKERKPLRILIVGESYCVIEPLVNFHIIEFLGHAGVFAEPFLTSHRWLFRHALRIDDNKLLKNKRALKDASKIWAYPTGGEDQVSIGFALNARRLGFDGVIHLMPFGCMPETAALTVFESIARSGDIPVLNISLDEHSGHTGVCTRIEAFIDLLESQRAARSKVSATTTTGEKRECNVT